MGCRGPQKIPTKILEQRGSWKIRERKGEPQPESGRPSCPSWLSKESKKKWKELIPQLDDMGVLTKIDRSLLTLYCDLWGRYERASRFLTSHPPMFPIKDKDGEVIDFKEWPQAKESLNAIEKLIRLGQLFGLTPSSRASLTVNKQTEAKADGKARFFKIATSKTS